MRYPRMLMCCATVAASLVLGAAAAASPALTSGGATNFRANVSTSIDFSQGECCAFWYFGHPTAVTLPRIGPATLTTFFIQCFAVSVCTPQNSQLTLTFETKKGDKLVLLGYAPNLGTATNDGTDFRLDVDGTWTVQPDSTGRFAGYDGSSTFSLDLVQPAGSFGGSEHISLDGALGPR